LGQPWRSRSNDWALSATPARSSGAWGHPAHGRRVGSGGLGVPSTSVLAGPARMALFCGVAGHGCCNRSLRQKRPTRLLDSQWNGPRMVISPPIRFRIEWACDQGNRHRFLVSGPFKFLGRERPKKHVAISTQQLAFVSKLAAVCPSDSGDFSFHPISRSPDFFPVLVFTT
jgi:hypothetical protein